MILRAVHATSTRDAVELLFFELWRGEAGREGGCSSGLRGVACVPLAESQFAWSWSEPRPRPNPMPDTMRAVRGANICTADICNLFLP
jgi:hypothetical protein